MRYLSSLIIILSLAFMSACGPSTQILILRDSPIMGAKSPSLDSVKQAVVKGCLSAGWTFEDVRPGQLVATFKFEDREAKVDILYNTETYNIIYKDSKNMNFEDNLIHPRYNRWIIRLDKSIRKATLSI